MNILMRLIMLIIVFFIWLPVHGAQLVDKIPVRLIENWTVCIDYLERVADCQQQTSPELNRNVTGKVKQYIYNKEFIVSSNLQQATLGLWLDVIDDVDEVRINDRLIGKTGNFPPQFESGFRHKRHYLIPSVFIKYNQFNKLEIKTFSSVNLPGLSDKPIIIGNFFKMSHFQQELDYVYVICITILLLLTLFQMFYYFMVKGSNETNFLSFSLIAFAMIAFIRSDAPMHIGLNLSSVFKVEMFILSFATVALSLFALKFFELKVRFRYIAACSIIAVVGMINILYPNPIHARLVAEVSYFLIGACSSFMLVSAIIVSWIKNRKYVVVVGFIFGAISLALTYDALSQASSLINFQLSLMPFILPLTVAFAGIGMALTITHRYWQIFKGATYDHLTQTLLRPAFFQRLTEEIASAQNNNVVLLLAVINIEEVKNIGVSYGKITHNKMLKAVSQTIRDFLEPTDLICQLNDDEFCISSYVESAKQAENQLRNLHKSLANIQQIINKDTEIYISAKVAGVIYNSERHLSISQLLQDANYAMAKVKAESNKDFLLLSKASLHT